MKPISSDLLEDYLADNPISLPTPVSPDWDTVDNEEMIQYFNGNLTTQFFINGTVNLALFYKNLALELQEDLGVDINFYLYQLDIRDMGNNTMTLRIKFDFVSGGSHRWFNYWFSFRFDSFVLYYQYIDYDYSDTIHEHTGLLQKVGLETDEGLDIFSVVFLDEAEGDFSFQTPMMSDIQNILPFLPYYEYES